MSICVICVRTWSLWRRASGKVSGVCGVALRALSSFVCPECCKLNHLLSLIGCSVILGPIMGVIVTDYHVVNKRKLDVDGLYRWGPGRYWFKVSACAWNVFIGNRSFSL